MAEASRRPWHPPAFVKLSGGIHAASLAALALAPEHWPLALGSLALNHAVLSTAGMWPRSRLLGANILRLPASAEHGVALTFDDGPDPDVTPRVLDLLDRHQARATFFVVGRKVEAHPALAREIQARGHLVENHTYRHGNGFAFLGPRGMQREIEAAQEAIEGATGRRPTLFRAPAGIRNPWLDLVLARTSLSLVSWTRRGFDTVTRDPGRVAGRLIHGLRAGDILLLHDGSSASGLAGQPVVLEALPRVLEALAARQLGCVPVFTEPTTIAAPASRPAPGYGT